MSIEAKRDTRVMLAISEAEGFVYTYAQPPEDIQATVEILLEYIEILEGKLDK